MAALRAGLLAAALCAVAPLQSATLDEFVGVWVLEAAGAAPAADGDLAIWPTATGFGVTWKGLPPDGVRRTFEFARGADGVRLDIARSDPALAADESVAARLESGRLHLVILSGDGETARQAQYRFVVGSGELLLDYRLRQGARSLESATHRLRRIKVVM